MIYSLRVFKQQHVRIRLVSQVTHLRSNSYKNDAQWLVTEPQIENIDLNCTMMSSIQSFWETPIVTSLGCQIAVKKSFRGFPAVFKRGRSMLQNPKRGRVSGNIKQRQTAPDSSSELDEHGPLFRKKTPRKLSLQTSLRKRSYLLATATEKYIDACL